MARVSRKDNTLNDAIEMLDQFYIRADKNVPAALEMLSVEAPDALAFIEMETASCLDLRYYLENYHCISDENGNFRALWPWWDHQEILYEAMQEEWAENGYCKVIVLKPRQTGISVWTAASMLHRTIFTPHSFTMLVAQNPIVSTALQKMVLAAYFALPWWLRPEYMYKTKGDTIEFQRKDEKERLVNPGLGSTIHVSHAAKQSGVAIGRTIRNGHFSEVSRWPSDEVFHADINPTMNARDTYAVMESTGLGRNGLFYEWWTGSVEGDTGWRPVFIPVYKVKKYYLPIRGKHALGWALNSEEIAFNARVKKEEKFDIPEEFWNFRRQGIRAAKRGDGKAGFLESYPITPAEAFQGSGICAFDAESLEEQEMKYICKPLWAGEIFLDPDGVTPNFDALRVVADDEILPKRKGARSGSRLHVWAQPQKGETFYIACLPDGEPIRTKRGSVPIEQVVAEDKLLDEKGNYVGITAIMRRKYEGELICIKSYGSTRPVKFTPNHPLSVIDETGNVVWKKAGEVTTKDIVRFPKPNRSVIRGRELLDKWPVDAVRENFRIDPACLWDTEFWWFAGLWLADGHAREKNKMGVVVISLNAKKESYLADRLKKFIFSISGRECWQMVTKDNSLRIQFNSVQFCRFLKDNFGDRAINKRIPEWVKTLPQEHRASLVQGYFHGDGSLVDRGSKSKYKFMGFVSVSENLIIDMQDLLLSLGIFGSAGVLREAGKARFSPSGKEFKTVKTYDLKLSSHYTTKLIGMWGREEIKESCLKFTESSNRHFTWWDDNVLCSKVYKIERERYEGFVNNFETETHTFCAGMMTTHNCDVALGVAEGDFSMACVYLAGAGNNPDELVANWWGHIPPEHFARVLVALGYWYNGAEIACEYEKEGITTGNKLVEMDYPALYRERLKDRPGSPFKVYFHFSMTQKTRSQIIATMNEALLSRNARGEPGVIWHCEELLDEARDFASIEGSKMEGQGNHDDGIVSAMIGLYCLRETTMHIKASPDSAHVRETGDINVYGVYDNLMRQRGQYGTPAEALAVVGANKGWSVMPILVCNANTLHSVIDTPGTAEYELRYKHGISRRAILPDVVAAYRDAVGFNGYGSRSSVDTSDPDW